MATPDVARLTLEVETQAATAVAAGQENAKQADAVLKAVKAGLGPEDKLRTLGYSLFTGVLLQGQVLSPGDQGLPGHQSPRG